MRTSAFNNENLIKGTNLLKTKKLRLKDLHFHRKFKV